MAYTDPDTVRLALTPGGDEADVGTAAYLEDTDLDAAIADASDEVNATLAGRYAVPFADPAPDLIKTITTAIAAYLVTLTARGGDPLDRQDPVALRNARAVRLLGQLQSGAMQIGGGSGGPAGTPSVAVSNILDGPMFSPADFPVPGRYPSGSGRLSPTSS